jgi:hypothetical protein
METEKDLFTRAIVTADSRLISEHRLRHMPNSCRSTCLTPLSYALNANYTSKKTTTRTFGFHSSLTGFAMSLKGPHKVGGNVYVASSFTESLCPWPQCTYQRVPATHSVPSELRPFGHSRMHSQTIIKISTCFCRVAVSQVWRVTTHSIWSTINQC